MNFACGFQQAELRHLASRHTPALAVAVHTETALIDFDSTARQARFMSRQFIENG